MVDKGENVGTRQGYVLRRSSNGGIVSTITVNGLELEPETQYVAVLERQNGPNPTTEIAEFHTKTDKKAKAINIPKNEVDENQELKPGISVNVKMYETLSPDELAERENNQTVQNISGSKVISRVEAVADESNSDGIHSILRSAPAAKYISENEITRVKFRNLDKNEEAFGITHTDYSTNGKIAFPHRVRKLIDVEPGDLIELVDVDGNNTRLENKVEEIHDMVSEMYTAYLNNKDD